MAVKSNRVPLLLGKDAYEKLQAYSELTGVPIARAAERAIVEWLATVGEVHMEVMAARHSGKLLLPKIPATRPAAKTEGYTDHETGTTWPPQTR